MDLENDKLIIKYQNTNDIVEDVSSIIEFAERYKYGEEFDRSNLYKFLRFYKVFPKIVDAVSGKFRTLLV